MAKIILIVEDYDDDVVLLQRLLTRIGIVNPVRILADGAEALDYLSGQSPYTDRSQHPFPSIIFVDLQLPRIDGFQVLAWLKTQPEKSDILEIAISVSNDMRSICRAYDLGAHSFLTKPCRQSDLENLIQGFPHYWTRSAPTLSSSVPAATE